MIILCKQIHAIKYFFTLIHINFTNNNLRVFMKTTFKIIVISVIIGLFAFPVAAKQPAINFYRNPDQRGLHVFEAPKQDTVPFSGLSVRIGGNFTQQYQSLEHSSNANPGMAGETDLNKLYPLVPGFNLATANLNFDIQLEDGIRVKLENYMSSRHHSEFWVKGGYIQVDKLPMFGSPDWFTRMVTVKIGHFGVNYGDQQFRRSDNGNTFHNPFVGNTIMDAFATEIGGEVYVRPGDDFFVMLGTSSGIINGDVKEARNASGEIQKKSLSMLAKVGYDKQINEDLRVRLSASYYTNPGTTRNTLYAGDRTGSRYYMASEPEFFRNFQAGGAVTASTAANRFTSGRLSPEFTHQVSSFMINPFIKFKGLELFGVIEASSGKHNSLAETRQFNQLSGEVVYRFLKNEQVFVGARYNQVSGELPGANADVSVDRIQIAAGWYTTKNLLVKLEYVNQNFNDFDASDFRHKGNFNGLMIEAAIAF